jgi:N-terminal domain of anti-restriction factor ArdC
MRHFRSNSAQRRDHYQELTDKIIAALEAGTAPWRRPWDKTACGGATTPINATTGRRYRGINFLVLGMSPLALASNDPRWCSYRQAAGRGWQVRKGEKATPPGKGQARRFAPLPGATNGRPGGRGLQSSLRTTREDSKRTRKVSLMDTTATNDLLETRSAQSKCVRVVSKRREPGAALAAPGETVIDVDRANPVLGNRHYLRDHRNDRQRAAVIAAHKRDFEADVVARGPMNCAIDGIVERIRKARGSRCAAGARRARATPTPTRPRSKSGSTATQVTRANR